MGQSLDLMECITQYLERLPDILCAVQPKANLRGEWLNMLLLVTLYAMQGVPLGLTMGSM